MSYRILIVDDTKFLRLMLTDLLVKAGHDVVGSAENGIVGVEKYKELRPDLVIMDITMPDMDGITALKEIKTIEADAVVLICSAMSQRDLISKALKAGANNYIMKPFEPERVNEVIQEVSSLVEKRRADRTVEQDHESDDENTQEIYQRSQDQSAKETGMDAVETQSDSASGKELDIAGEVELKKTSGELQDVAFEAENLEAPGEALDVAGESEHSDLPREAHNVAGEMDYPEVSREVVDTAGEMGHQDVSREVFEIAGEAELQNASGVTANEREVNDESGKSHDAAGESQNRPLEPFSSVTAKREEQQDVSEFGSLLGHREADGFQHAPAENARSHNEWSQRDVESDLAALLSQMESEAATSAERIPAQEPALSADAEVTTESITHGEETSSDLLHSTVELHEENLAATSGIEETHDPEAYVYAPSESEQGSKQSEESERSSADTSQIELKRKRMSNIASSIMCRWSERIDDKEINFIIVYNEYDKSLRIETISPDEQRNGITMSLDGFTFLRDWLEQKGVQFERFI